MKKLFANIIKRTVAIILVIIFILGFGLYATSSMAINLLPDINIPMVCIQVIYPGASATSVEEDVTVKLEDGLKAISGVTDVSSYSYDNLSAVVLSFDYGTDTKEKKTDINSKLSGITLPDGCTTTVYDIDLNSQALAVLSVTGGETLDITYQKAEELKTALAAIEGVESVEIMGGGENVVNIIPYVGSELISLLFVQALSYGELDIPLGNLLVDGSDVQIRNNSDFTSVEDIKNAPLSIPSSFVSLLSSVKQVMNYYEDSTQEDLVQLRDDLNDGVQQVLSELGEMSYEEINKFATLKTYMNIASSYTASSLTSFKTSRYYNEIAKQVEGKDDDELTDLADDINDNYPQFQGAVSVDLLKIVRDGKLDALITYRQWLEGTDNYRQADKDNEYYELTDDDYLVLARLQTLNIVTFNDDDTVKESIEAQVGMNVYPFDEYPSDEEVKKDINFVKQTSATGLSAIGDKKEDEGDDYYPTNEECALLFTGTTLSSDHPIVMSSMFMAFVRDEENYEDNMQKLIDKRGEFDAKVAEDENYEISAQEYYDLYNDLVLDNVFEVVLSTDLISFILDKDLGDLTTASDGSSVLVVKVGDLAKVEMDQEYSSYAYYGSGGMQIINGIIINIYKSNGANSSAVVNEVKKTYKQMTEQEGFGVSVNLLDDQSEFISDSISNVLVSMLIGGVLAILIIFIFLKKVKPSLVIAVTMPLSVLSALICMYLMGITLNMVSLGGLAVGIGMLVDNSIVVIEAITKHRDTGKNAYHAAVDGVCEVGGALIGSTITTVCVFIPIIFSGGLTGEIFTDLSWAVIFSLTFSLIIAVTVIPTLYSMLYGGDKQMLRAGEEVTSVGNIPSIDGAETSEAVSAETTEEAVADVAVDDKNNSEIGKNEAVTAENVSVNELNKTGEKSAEKVKKNRITLKEKLTTPYFMQKIERFYKKILPSVINKKIITVCLAVVVFAGSAFMVTLTGTEFLPSIDKGQIEIKMSYGASALIDDVQDDVLAFTETVNEKIENIDYISASVGKNGLLALTDTGLITVQLTTSRHTNKVVEQIRELAKETAKDGRTVTVSEVDGVVASLVSGSSGMSVTIMGEDIDKLSGISSEICAQLNEQGFTDITDSLTEKSLQYRLTFDQYKVADLGLDYTTLVTTLRVGIASYTAATVEIEGQSYSLNVMFDESTFEGEESKPSIEKLANFIVGYDGTDAIHLKDVLKIDDSNRDTNGIIVEETDACIRRSNGYNTVVITAQHTTLDTGTASDQMKDIAKKVLAKDEYSGYTFESSGVSSYLEDAFEGLAVALVISFFLLYAVMAIQFSSFIKPIIIMSSIPFSFTGGFLALVITGTSLNVVSFIGLIMLMGVIVNNAIVMLEKIKQLHEEEGMTHYDAILNACSERLRPILMTTLTTILALIPLAIGIGKGSELMQPLGIVVIGGLLVGTIVTLIIVPAVYCLFNRISKQYPNGKGKKSKDVNIKNQEAKA